MNLFNGRVEFFGMKPTRSLQRHVERQIEKWIERQQTLLFFPKTGNFSVQIERATECPKYECAIEVRIGTREWRSYEEGRTLQDALMATLKHLKISQVLSISKNRKQQPEDRSIVA